MANDPARAALWTDFISTKCDYPAPALLRAQLEKAEFTEFCDCGCNSFDVCIPAGAEVEPLVPPGTGGAIYTADFMLADGRTLEIILFADDRGNLSGVEVDCCANAYPVPEQVAVEEAAIDSWASDRVFR